MFVYSTNMREQLTKILYYADTMIPILLHDDLDFPDANLALAEPNGLLAIGGDLSPARLIKAYRHGIFPWYSDDQPILWWSPNPRCLLFPADIKISRSLNKTLKRMDFTVSFDEDFAAVIQQCSALRSEQQGTWITTDMIVAYQRLHQLGIAHSVEVRRDGELIGGLYGLAIGKAFFGESMFSTQTDASKIALVYLARQLLERGYHFIDCQLPTPHLKSMGAVEVQRQDYLHLLQKALIE